MLTTGGVWWWCDARRYHQQLLVLLSEVPDYAQGHCRTLAIAMLSFLRDDYYGAESRRDLDANELGMDEELHVRSGAAVGCVNCLC